MRSFNFPKSLSNSFYLSEPELIILSAKTNFWVQQFCSVLNIEFMRSSKKSEVHGLWSTWIIPKLAAQCHKDKAEFDARAFSDVPLQYLKGIWLETM